MNKYDYRDLMKKSLQVKCTNYMYCQKNTCSEFISLDNISSRKIECQTCGTTHCPTCKQLYHGFTDCKSNDTDLEFMALMKANEVWKSCPGCNHAIEHNKGCYHMMCKCKFEFCWVCLSKWKTCTCPNWEEQQLVHE
jgi:hypothetical protein